MLKHRLFYLRVALLLLTALPVRPVFAVDSAANEPAERNPAYRARISPPAMMAMTAQVIVKLRSDADLVRRHALSATASPRQTDLAIEERTLG